MNDRKVVVLNHVDEIEFDDLDLQLNNLHGGVHVTGECKGTWSGEGQIMTLDELEVLIRYMKEKGASYIEIMYHMHHRGYVFNFYKD